MHSYESMITVSNPWEYEAVIKHFSKYTMDQPILGCEEVLSQIKGLGVVVYSPPFQSI